jgi:hypothetical protein
VEKPLTALRCPARAGGATLLKEKVEIKKHLPIVIAEKTSVLRISHIRVDFQRIEMIGQVHHGCG